ncbi:MAG TPA: transglycosylase domain-containing protein [Candidatus Saccharimonadales bacterium]|nr:transglycosylase domain-containing protein [Candidatus Saccharimonadales bacterium]
MASTNGGRQRRSRNTVTTKSGKVLKVNTSFSDRVKAGRAERAAARATYLSSLPKEPLKRLLYRLRPKHLAEYWFSREGGIMALKLVGVAIVLGFFLTIGLFAYFRKDLPKIKDISGDSLGGNITYYDRTGKIVLWQDYSAVKRIPVQGTEINQFMKDATVAVEDKGFYKEGAFDVRGILRAASHDIVGGGGSLQGGSTITQQLVKLNEGWTNNRTITRKVKELILAVELERQYSKKDILTGYLNIAPYGGVDYGVESAAQDYFQTTAKDLTLPEAAMLAAIPQAPGVYSPYSSPQYNPAVTDNVFDAPALIGRQHYVLDLMVQQGYITKAQAEAAKKVDILSMVHQQAPKYQGIKAPYFVLAAKQQLTEQFGSKLVDRGGWKVTTTLDMNLQNHDEQLISDNFSRVQRLTGYLADDEANVTEDVKTGQIVALVGGVDFSNPTYGKLNFAARLVSPGSSFKPYDYVTMINNNNNVGAGSVLYDSQGAIPGYPCTDHSKPPPHGTGNCLADYDFLTPGPITLRYALGGSRNIPAEKAMLEAVPGDTSPGNVKSINKTIDTASALMDNPYLQSKGQSTYNCYVPGADLSAPQTSQQTQCYNSAAIGDGAYLQLDDHVNGLASLARLGQAIPRTFILKITDAANQTVYQWTQPKAKQVVKPDAAYILNDMAADPNASYLPGSCNATSCTGGITKFHRFEGWHFAVKTGTTNFGFDGLMASWSPKYATVTWVGNHTRNVDIQQKTGVPMETLTEPITRGMMEFAHEGQKPENWVAPKDIKVLPAFVVRNHIHYGDVEPSPSTDLFPSWYAGGNKSKGTSQTIDKVSGLTATSCTPDLAKDTQNNANVATWNVDLWAGGKPNIGTSSKTSNTTQSTDNVHNCNDSAPTVTLTAPDSCDASSGGCTITVTASQGTHPLSGGTYTTSPAGTIDISLNGSSIGSCSIPADESAATTCSITYVPTSTGSGTLTATVVDSVLYAGTATGPFAYTATQPLVISIGTHNGTHANLSWNSVTGATSYQLCITDKTANTTQCYTENTTSDNVTVLPSRSYSANVTANDPSNTASNTVTWTQN